MLSSTILKDANDNTADESIYHMDANCPLRRTDCAVREEGTYIIKEMGPHRAEKMQDLNRAVSSHNNILTRVGTDEATERCTYQSPNVHTADGQRHVRLGRTCTAYIIDHTFCTNPQHNESRMIDVSEHDGDSTDHGIMIGCMKLASNGYLTPTEEETSTNTAPDTYEITTDENQGRTYSQQPTPG
jgi:hypothetical protein